MKTIFVVGLFEDRHKTIFNYLCQNFNVIVKEPPPDKMGENNYSVINHYIDLKYESKKMHFACNELIMITQTLFKQYWSENESEFLKSNITNQAKNLFFLKKKFSLLAKSIKIDLVFSSTDYLPEVKAIVLQARQLGIPTFCIEHSLSSIRFPMEAYREYQYHVREHVSDYINLENKFELDFFPFLKNKNGKKILFLGTPLDCSPNQGEIISKIEARKKLKIKKNTFTVSIMGSWSAPLHLRAAYIEKLDEIECYENILSALKLTKTQIVIKLHPAYDEPELLKNIKAFFRKLSNKLKISISLITCCNFPLILAASDLIITINDSSTGWEGLVLGKPVIIYLSRFLKDNLRDFHTVIDTNFLMKNKFVQIARDQETLLFLLNYFLHKNNYKNFQKKWYEFSFLHDIQNLSVIEKSENICKWIKTRNL